jgi:hypothetical protein
VKSSWEVYNNGGIGESQQITSVTIGNFKASIVTRRFTNPSQVKVKIKIKSIPTTGRGGPRGCETSRLPHFLDNRLRDGGEVVSPTRRPLFTPQEDSWYLLLLEAESNPRP